MKFDREKIMVTEAGGLSRIALAVGLIGLSASVAGYFVDPNRFFHGYLIAATYWVSLGLGGLFFTMLHHLTGATWSVVVRRISENLMMTLPFTALLFIPVLFGMHDLYHWSHPEAVAHDALLQSKAGFLNPTFFAIRTVIYFAIWNAIGFALYLNSRKQDSEPNKDYIRKMRMISGGGMVLFALSVTFAGFDWLMSLNPHWYSTIFGAYFFAGGLISILCLITTIAACLHYKGILTEHISVEHFHDLGKLMLGFTIFWGYVGGSQYFIIWYANLPEETIWYLVRWQGTWEGVTWVLIFGHFVIPFIALLFQNLKRKVWSIAAVAMWILIMHWVDLYWLIMPTYEGAAENAHFSWVDPVAMLGIGGIFFWSFLSRLRSAPLVPIGDPFLQESIEFENR